MPKVDHGRTEVHDVGHNLIGHNHNISVPAGIGDATWQRLHREGYGYLYGWVDRDGKHGPAGQRWLFFTRRENLDGTITRPVTF
jgi:hypothetical protein